MADLLGNFFQMALIWMVLFTCANIQLTGLTKGIFFIGALFAIMIIRNFIERKIKTVWIDPENKNRMLTKKYSGTYIDWGQNGNIINPFDLKPRSSDEDLTDADMWDTEMAIYDVIDEIKTIFKSLYPDIDVEQLAIVSQLVLASFDAVGIKKDVQTQKYPSFQNMNLTDMPTFTTFNDCLEKYLHEQNCGEVLPILSVIDVKDYEKSRIAKAQMANMQHHCSILLCTVPGNWKPLYQRLF